MKIRVARIEDAEPIARIHVIAWQVAYKGIIPDAVLDNLSVEKRIARWQQNLFQQLEDVLVVEADGVVRGWATFGPSRDDDANSETGELYALYLDPAAWRKGLGKSLCAEVDARLREAGFGEETLWVLEGNERARAFYASIGFQYEGFPRAKVRVGVPVTEMRYRKPLTSHLQEK